MTYTLDNSSGSAADFFKRGKRDTNSCRASGSDVFGAAATEVVTLTITGTNDAPMITTAAGQDAGAVSEAGVNPGNTAFAGPPSARRTLTSSVVGHGATTTWSGSASSTYGAFAVNATTRAWTYTLDNSS